MGKKALKDFIQCIQNKVSIISAIAVIKLKPDNLTGEQYAGQIQKLVFENWVQNNDVTIFENKIIELQRHQLFEEVKGLLTPADQGYQALNNEINDTIPGVCSELSLDTGFLTDSEEDNSDSHDFETNVSFIQAIIQLKFAVDSCNTISFETVSNLLDKLSKPNNEECYSGWMINYSEDSGFGENNSQRIANSISTSAFKFITHSSRTEHLIKKCMVFIIKFIYKSLICSPVETFSNWKGSVLEYLCSILKEVSFHPVCSDCLLSFIIKSIDEVWRSDETNKHLIWEYQLHILSEFCVNSYISENVINSVMDKFNALSGLIDNMKIGSPEHLNNIHILEKVPHFTQLASSMIKKLYSYHVIDPVNLNKGFKKTAYNNVIDLWKLKWEKSTTNGSDCAKENLKDSLTMWKDVCEKMTTTSAVNFSMFSFYMWDVTEQLHNLIKDMA